MAAEFLTLDQLIGAVESTLAKASEQMDRRRGSASFVLGECTMALSLELQTDGDVTMARFPSFIDDKPPIPPEYLSRLTLTLRHSVAMPLDR